MDLSPAVPLVTSPTTCAVPIQGKTFVLKPFSSHFPFRILSIFVLVFALFLLLDLVSCLVDSC